MSPPTINTVPGRNSNGTNRVVLEDVPPVTRRGSFVEKAYTKGRHTANFVTKDISGPSLPRDKVIRAVSAEFFGTMFFVFAVAASVTIPANLEANVAVGQLITAFIQGMALVAMVSACGPTSGGHLNPAVTLALMIVRTIPILRGIMYMIAQVLGAMVGAALFSVAVGHDESGTLGATVPTVSDGRAIMMEFMLTAFLIYTVLGTAVHGKANGIVKALAPIPIGFAVLVGVMIAKNVTGASMNPARSFGPAVVSGTWSRQWLYWVAPLLAAAVVGTVYKAYFLSARISDDQARQAGLLPMSHPGSPRSQETVVDMPDMYGHSELSEADLVGHEPESLPEQRRM